ncbi:retrotransposon protein, putative, ty1-copia subclass, partial [Tanacetum coccineum]
QCHLGHVSKKRIEKLQHDGLLNSTDIESFGKCVSCLSGKMAGACDYFPSTHPYTPQHNGVSERRNRTLLDMVRLMMSQTIHPKSFWDYALESITQSLNMVPTKKIEKTPYEVWHRQVPKMSYLRVWGCEALIKRDTLTKPDKLEPISIKCIFVGYPKETMSYSFYYPPENKHELGDLNEPANYKAALLDPKSDKWLAAMNVELQSMKDNQVCDLVGLPPNGKTVGSK